MTPEQNHETIGSLIARHKASWEIIQDGENIGRYQGADPGADPGKHQDHRITLAGVVLRITESEDQPQDAGLLRNAVLVLLKNPGMEPVYLEIQTPDGPVMMEMPMINTNYSPELTEELQQILGPDTVSLKGSETRESEPAAA